MGRKVNNSYKHYTNFYYSKLLKRKKFQRMIPSETFVSMYKFFIKKKKIRILDFGVGEGRHYHYLTNQGHEVFGTDISKESLDLTKLGLSKRDQNLIHLDSKDYLDQFPVSNFNLIVCWEVIHWLGNLDDIKKLLIQFGKILKKKGKIFITFPAEDHYLIDNKLDKNYVCKIKAPERKNAIICAPSLHFLKKIFKKNNMIIEGIFRYSFGRTILNKKLLILNESWKSADYKSKLFSMYAFALKKD